MFLTKQARAESSHRLALCPLLVVTGIILLRNFLNYFSVYRTRDTRTRNPTVSLRIFDVSGRLIRVLVEGSKSGGRHAAAWDGRDAFDTPVAPGVYFARLRSGRAIAARKIVRGTE